VLFQAAFAASSHRSHVAVDLERLVAPSEPSVPDRTHQAARARWEYRARVPSSPRTAPTTMRSTATPRSLGTRLEAATSLRLARCYQCGKCSAGCPMAGEMDHPPSRLLRLLQTGEARHDDAVLGSSAIWICLGCETCVSRCPNEVDLPRAIDFLRAESLAAGKAHPAAQPVLAFHRAFLGGIARHGRLYELELIALYKLATRRLLQDVGLAPAMLMTGKLGFLPHHTPGRAAAARIVARAAAVEAADRETPS
jgi:heterodisulfide reductase subunit C